MTRLFCRMGWHKWEKDPSHKELIKKTGSHFVFFSEGVQKGIRKCLRKGCVATQKVSRTGWVGNGGQSTRWKKLSPRKEKSIDSLPVM